MFGISLLDWSLYEHVGEQLFSTITLQRLRCLGALHNANTDSNNNNNHARTHVVIDIAVVDVCDELAPVDAHRIALHAGVDDDAAASGAVDGDRVGALRVTVQSLDTDSESDVTTRAEMSVRVELQQPRILLLARFVAISMRLLANLQWCVIIVMTV